ncbi:protein O-GlcNAc transferase [Azospirillaceae bacterium]
MLAHQNGQNQIALELLRAAAALAPLSHYRNNFGILLCLQGHVEEARAELEAALAAHPQYPNTYLSLASVLEQLKRPQEAAAVLLRLARGALQSRNANLTSQALDRLLAQPEPHHGLLEFAHHLRLAGDVDNAERVVNRLIQTHPDDPGLLLCRAIAKLPIIYQSVENAAACREAYIASMSAFRAQAESASPEQCKLSALHVGMAKPFILSYQGFDDVALQRDYGVSISRFMHIRYPTWAAPIPVPEGPPWRIGFATAYWNLHSVSKLFGGWVRSLDRRRFTVYGYDFNTTPLDLWGRPLSEACDVFRPHPPPPGESTESWARTIAADRLHALIYLEIGMHPTAVRLATLRLAPVQAMTWGHPVTSGFPMMDMFLSSDFMEPPDGQLHYTETLVRLPGLSICYLPLPSGEGTLTRAEVGLRADSVAFICCQSLFKYRPIDDDVLPRIAAELPDAQFLFIGDPTQWTTQVFRARLERAFVAKGVDPSRHLVFTAPIPVPKFPALLQLSDVYLDSLAWSGGNTSLEAATVGLPMVTMSGGLMRGRHTTGILWALGLDELIADSKEAYVRIAVRLGRDKIYRQSMAERTMAAQASLFGDQRPVRALETVLEQAIFDRIKK